MWVIWINFSSLVAGLVEDAAVYVCPPEAFSVQPILPGKTQHQRPLPTNVSFDTIFFPKKKKTSKRTFLVVVFFSGLDLTDFVMKTDEPAPIYDLVGVSCHSGGLGGGHYWAVCQNKDDNEWYKFDDSRVNPASDADIDVRYTGPLIIFHSTFLIFKKIWKKILKNFRKI